MGIPYESPFACLAGQRATPPPPLSAAFGPMKFHPRVNFMCPIPLDLEANGAIHASAPDVDISNLGSRLVGADRLRVWGDVYRQ